MKCPIDHSELVMTERQGIEIDYCPKCRGVWLDRGELDKIIERSAAASPPPVQPVPPPPPAGDGPPRYEDGRSGRHGRDDRYGRDDRHYGDDRRPEEHRPRRRKRGSFLEELFDFDFD